MNAQSQLVLRLHGADPRSLQPSCPVSCYPCFSDDLLVSALGLAAGFVAVDASALPEVP